MDVFQTRQALADALTAHNVERVRPFLHPLYVVRSCDGAVVLDCHTFVAQLPQFFRDHPEYRQSIELEESRIESGVATLTTRHIDLLRNWWHAKPIASRWDETWREVNGQWTLIEERPHTDRPDANAPTGTSDSGAQFAEPSA